MAAPTNRNFYGLLQNILTNPSQGLDGPKNSGICKGKCTQNTAKLAWPVPAKQGIAPFLR
jgi:hypothetical protein